MKSEQQILSFIHQYKAASFQDSEMIKDFLQKHYQIPSSKEIFSKHDTTEQTTLSYEEFIKWFESKFASASIISHNNVLKILGTVYKSHATSIAYLLNDKIKVNKEDILLSDITLANLQEEKEFLKILTKQNLQYSLIENSLIEKYIPDHDQQVIFHKYDYTEEGVGVIRQVYEKEGAVEFYCYYIYPGPNTSERIGYSMHEFNIANVYEYVFEPIANKTNELGTSGHASIKRLRRELARHNKIWKDKLHRIEPLTVKVKKGEKYWYINDKLKLVMDVEKETPTSHFRYMSGNYFTDYVSALMILSQIQDNIQKYLASPTWPKSDL